MTELRKNYLESAQNNIINHNATEGAKNNILRNIETIKEHLEKLKIGGGETPINTELHNIVNLYLDVLYQEDSYTGIKKEFAELIHELSLASQNLLDDFDHENLEKFSECITSLYSLFQMVGIFEGGGKMFLVEIMKNNPLDIVLFNSFKKACDDFTVLKRHFYSAN